MVIQGKIMLKRAYAARMKWSIRDRFNSLIAGIGESYAYAAPFRPKME